MEQTEQTQADPQETYQVPSEVFIALTTGRTQFLTHLRRHVEAGTLIPQEQQVEMVRLLGDLIIDRQKNKETIQELENKLKDIELNARGLEGKLNEIRTGLMRKDGL